MNHALGIKLYTIDEAKELEPEGYYLTIEDGFVFCHFGAQRNKWTTMRVNPTSAYDLWDERNSSHRYLSIKLTDSNQIRDVDKEFSYINPYKLSIAAKITLDENIDVYDDKKYLIYINDNIIIAGYFIYRDEINRFCPYTLTYTLIETIFSLMRRY